jgi:MFS family permease
MVATLPGRTHGLGLVTEPVLQDLSLDRVAYATLNLWATLIGAAFCLPVGWLLDRLGVRWVLAGVAAALGVVVVLMAGVTAGGSTIPLAPTVENQNVSWFTTTPVPLDLFVLVTLTRGLGQSALSVVSLALMGKAAGRTSGLVVGVYSFVMAVGFMAAFGGIGQVMGQPEREAKSRFEADTRAGTATGTLDDYQARAKEEYRGLWRKVWGGIGWSVVGAAVGLPLLVRRLPARRHETPDGDDAEKPSLTLPQAARTAGFWVFGLATSFYGLLTSGLSLFNQSVLAERGFEASVFYTITAVGPLVGLAANLVSGLLARAGVRLGDLLAGAMVMQGVALVLFPNVTTLTHVYAYAAAMGVAGGALTVVFFAYWTQAYGPKHLGRIQGLAQMLTVFASAVGPLVLAAGWRAHGSYAPVLQQLSAVSFAFAVLAAVVPMPNRPRSEPTATPGASR